MILKGTKNPPVLNESVKNWVKHFLILKLFSFIADLNVACGY